MADGEHFDVVIIGAGISSLAAAKEYVQCAPSTKLIILNDNKTIGGVWSKDKVYPGLRTNNHRGTLELPDYPFGDHLGIKHGEHMTGDSVHQYLLEYAQKFDLARRVRHQTKALQVEKLRDGKHSGWRILVGNNGHRYMILADKLIVGTGLFSAPQQLHVQGEDTFNVPFLHAGELAQEGAILAKAADIHRVTVLGGSKYAWDCVYTMAAAGKEIDWVIKKSGHGPAWMGNIYAHFPILGAIWAEKLVTTRFVTWLSPTIFGGLDGSSWWRKLLHGTWLGRKIVNGWWNKMGSEILTQGGFCKDASTKILEPDCGFFDIGTNFAVLNYPTDILDFVRKGQVKVYRQDVSHLSDHTIHLANGTTLTSDALLASTGWSWQPSIEFKDKDIHSDLGVPSLDYTPSQKAMWADLDRKSDAYLFKQFPMLTTRPQPPQRAMQEHRTVDPHNQLEAMDAKPVYEPQRLYRTICPPGPDLISDRSLAFAGFGANISHPLKAELTGLWIYAYFNDKLTVDPVRDVADARWEASLMQRWAFRRYTYGFGARFPDYIWDAIPFNDLLLRDLGMNGCRKGGWWREMFEPYGMEDYRGITDEWLTMQKKNT